MKLTSSEISNLSKLAAKGRGHSWAIASEAGNAAKWLALNGFDVGAVVLEAIAAEPTEFQYDEPIWRCLKGSPLNPLYVGASICDFITIDACIVKEVKCPAVLSPFLASAAKLSSKSIELSWPNATVLLDGCRDRCQFSGEAVNTLGSVDANIRIVTEAIQASGLQKRCVIDEVIYEKLNSLAEKTYAPATEESRRLGAGGA